MKRDTLFYILLIVVALGVVAYIFNSQSMKGMQNAPTGATTSKIEANTVQAKGYAFSPQTIKIKKGTTVTWENYDPAPHTVTMDDKSKKGPNSKLFGKGQKFSYTFNDTGTYAYHCEPHPYMKGTVEVTE